MTVKRRLNVKVLGHLPRQGLPASVVSAFVAQMILLRNFWGKISKSERNCDEERDGIECDESLSGWFA